MEIRRPNRMAGFKRQQRDRECKTCSFFVTGEVPRLKIPFQDKIEHCRKDCVETTLETNMLDVVYSDRRVTVRDL